MVPLHDDNPTSSTPHVTYTLIGINVAVFLFQLSLTRGQLQQFFNSWAMVPDQLTASFSGQLQMPVFEWITLITSQFLHGGIFHIAGNMLYLWVFGNNIEDQLGKARFVIFYLGCGTLAGLTQWIFAPQSPVPTVGASGAIAGVMGAYILRFPKANILTLLPIFFFITTVRVPALFFLGFWFVQQALYGVASLGSEVNVGSGGVAYWAHAGGFVFGLILGPALGLMKGKGRRR